MKGGAEPDLLILEPAVRGHGREWLLHLADHARRCDPAPRLAFAVAPALADALRQDLPPGLPGNPEVIALSAREEALCGHRNLAVSGMARWWTMRRHLTRSGARHGLFLECDHLTLPLAMGLPTGRAVSGILFRPSVHYEAAHRPRRSERLRDLRKDVLYRRMLRHPAVRHVHSLDDAFPAFARDRYRGGDKVIGLPDPVFPLMQPSDADRSLADRVPADRFVMVLFGVLTERKGVLALLRALAMLDRATARRIAVIIAGQVDPPIRAEVDGALSAVAASQPWLWCHLEPRYLRPGEVSALVERTDAVLAPYQRFVGSSGVLMWAAGRGRPVIAQDYGLVGRLVREHGLGMAVDTSDPRALAQAMAEAAGGRLAELADRGRMAAFATARTPEAFAAAILEPVLRDLATRRAGDATEGSITRREIMHAVTE